MTHDVFDLAPFARLLHRLQQCTLALGTAAILTLGAWPGEPLRASVGAAAPLASAVTAAAAESPQSPSLRKYHVSLERIGGWLRAASNKDRLGRARSSAPRVGEWNHPLALAGKIEDEAGKLAGLEQALDDELAQDLARLEQIGSSGLRAAVQSAHDQIRQRLAQFRARVQTLTQARTASETPGISSAVQALADELANYESASGYATFVPDAVTAIHTQPVAIAPAADESALVARSGLARAPAPNMPTPADLAPSDEVQLTSAIRALAQSLDNNPARIRDWVYNNIKYLPTFGFVQGSDLTRINGQGNAFDQASLLIALLRVAGVPSRFVYGTIEISADQARKLTLATSAPMAIDLMRRGGIPTTAVVSGGTIQNVRLEHVWVEAWLDFIPSRGEINREGDQWVPMDVALKEQAVLERLELESQFPGSATAVAQSFANSATVAPDGLSVTGFDFSILEQAYAAHGQAIETHVSNTMPDATVDQLYRRAAIVPKQRVAFEGQVAFRVLATAPRFSAAPNNLKHQVHVRLYATYLDYTQRSPNLSWSIPAVSIGTQALGIRYRPANDASANALRNFSESNDRQMPLSGISVVPHIELDGTSVASGTATGIGTQHFWDAFVADPNGQTSGAYEPYRFAAGSEAVLGFDAAGVTPDMMKARSDRLTPGRPQALREGLYMAGLSYWFWHRHYEKVAADQYQSVTTPVASIGAFYAPLNVRYFFGIPRTGSMGGYATDVKAARFAVSARDAEALKRITFKAGVQGSFVEGSTWEQLFRLPQGAASTATSILMQANDERIPIYTITQQNIAQILPRLQLFGDSISEIQQAVAAGSHVLAPEREITNGGFTGAGYIVFNPVTGAALYRVDGGSNGALLFAFCLAKAFFVSCIFDQLVWYFYSRMILQLLPVDESSELAALLVNATEFVPIPTQLALAQNYIMFMAAHLAFIEVTVALATDDLDGLAAAYGIDVPSIELSALLCLLPSPCAGGGIGGGRPMPSGATGRGGGSGAGSSSGSSSGGNSAGGRRGRGFGNPVFTAGGEKYESETDYEGGGPFPLEFTRTYLSLSPSTSALGFHWRHSYERKLSIRWRESNGQPRTSENPQVVLVVRQDGSYMEFIDFAGTLRSPADYPTQLVRRSNGGNTTGFEYVNEDDEREFYDLNGRLTRIESRAGVAKTLQYTPTGLLQSVTDAFGRQLTFTYSVGGVLRTMTDPSQRVYRYDVGPSGMLVKVTFPDSKFRSYLYEGMRPGQLTGISDERGERIYRFRYDYKGRVIRAEGADGADVYAFRYLPDLVTEVTDPYGTRTRYEHEEIYEGSYRVNVVTQPCGTCGGDVSRQSFDSRGFLEETVDFNNNRTTYANENRGLATRVREAVGTPKQRESTYQWHAQFRLPTQMVEPLTQGQRTTNFEYDSRGNLLFERIQVGAETRTTAYTYNGFGQALTANGPRSDVADVSTSTYDAQGNLATFTDANGHVWRYTLYDADGQLKRMEDPNGLVTTMTYDERQRMTSMDVAGEVSTFAYDDAGNLTRITAPDGSFLAYTYDGASRVRKVEDNLGHSIDYMLNGAGDVIEEEVSDPQGTLVERMESVYDALGRLKDELGSEGQRTTYTYDGNGNEKSMTDPNNRRTDYDFDELDRLMRITDPNTPRGVVNFTYDPQDNLKSVTDPRGLATNYDYSGFDELTKLTSPDTGVTDYTYDASGNLKTRKDARNVTANYSYDPDNRLTSIAYPAFNSAPAETLTFEYDSTQNGNFGKGRLTRISDGSGNTTMRYDRHGRIVEKAQTVGSAPARTLQTSYLNTGQTEGHVLPSGAVIRFGYRADGRILTVSVNGVVVIREIEYHAFGEVKSWRYNATDSYTRTYDRDGRIKDHTAGPSQRTLTYDPASRITAQSDSAGGPNQWTFGYDALDRLTSAQNASAAAPMIANANLSWTYDPTGNRTQQSRDGTPVPYQIDPASNKLASVNTLARTFDPAGNTTNSGAGLTSNYNARNRLIQTSRASGDATYAHNAFGERVCKSPTTTACAQASNRIEYVYSDDGHLIGEYPSTGNAASDAQAQVEVLWLADTPVAILKRKPGSTDGGPTGGGTPTAWTGTLAGGVEVFYLHPDHLDTPRVAVNATNQQIWRWDALPFGDSYPNEQPTAGLPVFVFNLRFPGQQYDRETGTHYNYFRDYEPGTGRYVQSDPIGLGGGINSYLYAYASPVDYYDSKGERARAGTGRRPAHTATASLYRNGRLICSRSFRSGGYTGKGGYNKAADSHTEAKACRWVREDCKPRRGDVLVIRGSYQACTRCKGRMNDLNRECGVKCIYRWDGKEWTSTDKPRRRRRA